MQVTTSQASSINQSLAAIAQAESVLTLMIDYGDSWRDYKATGDKIFLQEFTKYKLQVPGALESLRALAGKSPLALRMAKWSANEVDKILDFEQAYRAVESRISLTLAASEDHQEAVRAFKEKRPPHWVGR